MWVRYVLVPGWSDAASEVEGVATFAAGLGNVERVDVLPFHQMGRFKWTSLGLPYELDGVAPPDAAAVVRASAPFRDRGLVVYRLIAARGGSPPPQHPERH